MIEFEEPLHQRGEQLVGHIGIALIQATAWWIAAELIRRHPGKLTAIETHPGGGMYDCLSVYRIEGDGDGLVVHMNFEGSITPGAWFTEGTQDRFQWAEVILTPRRRQYVVEQLEREQGLGAPSVTPSTVSSSIGVRAIAAFLSRTALGRGGHPTLTVREPGMPWSTLNGYCDTAGYGGGRRDELFTEFPGLVERRQAQVSGRFGDAGYRYWFVVDRKDSPRVAVDVVSGNAWNEVGEFDLMTEYRNSGSRLDPVVNKVFPAVQ